MILSIIIIIAFILFIILIWFLPHDNQQEVLKLLSELKEEKKTEKIPDEKPSKFVSKGERACREYLEKRFNEPFPNVRPRWLLNPKKKNGKNHRMEIDCYCEKLKLGVEYDGIHHKEYPNPFHKTREEFEEQVMRDNYKDLICKAKGVLLIRVPHDVPINKIPEYLDERL